MNLNFGICADETILNVFENDIEDKDYINLYVKWKGHLTNIKLHTYVIELNSTGGNIKIIAKGFRIAEVGL